MPDEKAMVAKLRKLGARKVLVQIPEGLKMQASRISSLLERNGMEALISVEPCFGACDLLDIEAKQLGCDALLHIGHSDFGLEAVLPVVYDEFSLYFDPVKSLEGNMAQLAGFKAIGLVTTAQHIGSLAKARFFLEKRKKEVLVGRSERLRPGQILGCDYSAAKSIESAVDCFLFIGSGRFHPLGLVQRTSRPVLFLDAESGKMSDISGERDKMEVKRRLRIEKARGLSRFGIFVSTKPGQRNIQRASKLKKALEKKGKKVVVITASMLTPEKISGMGFEVLVNTACPRIFEDQQLFRLVVLNPEDAEQI
jgi:2-(3-amino-3-carboxypropyl)histidine synthase